MDISLIICTRNRAPQLAVRLAAVGAVRARRDWEVIMVDNGSETSSTAEVVRAFATTASVPVLFAIEPRPRLGHDHNRGVALALSG